MTDNIIGLMWPTTRLRDRVCGWCGAVATSGPYAHPEYATPWFLCSHCADYDRMRPAPDAVSLDGYHYPVTVAVDHVTVAEWPDGTVTGCDAGAGDETVADSVGRDENDDDGDAVSIPIPGELSLSERELEDMIEREEKRVLRYGTRTDRATFLKHIRDELGAAGWFE